MARFRTGGRSRSPPIFTRRTNAARRRRRRRLLALVLVIAGVLTLAWRTAASHGDHDAAGTTDHTFAVADLVGFTALTETHGDEVTADVAGVCCTSDPGLGAAL